MGSPLNEADRYEDETQHLVTLTKGFWLAKTECTQEQWESVMRDNPSKFKGDDLPVETMSWDDVQEWIKKINSQTTLPSGWAWGLPTEAQWEYACRAGTADAGELDEMGWYGENSGERTNPVGTKKANVWGFHDMYGNVWEWCSDYSGDIASAPATDPTGPSSGSNRVFRGGGWLGYADVCRAAFRGGYAPPDDRGNDIGFRPALSSLPAR